MSVHISDLLDLEALDRALANGYVREQTHPTEPLRILNYTEKAAYERAWDAVTLNCRGLIVHQDGTIVARGYSKFFNHSEPEAAELDLSAPAEVTDKKDGSLAILYRSGDDWAIATRGSFTSEQALHATEVFRRRYSDFVPPDGVTPLFEILYPSNRIVIDYGATDDLVLLGGVETATGRPLGPGDIQGWPGPRTETFPARTLGEALTLPPRANAEGMVVRLLATGEMTKLKQADYVALHKVVTGLNARVVWESLGEGKTVADICEPLPDEFHAWTKCVAERLKAEAERILSLATAKHDAILLALGTGWIRKDYAALAAQSEHRAWLFMLLDGKDPAPKIWRTLRPSGDDRPLTVSEDTA